MKMKSILSNRGQALVGAMAAALVTSVVGTAVASNYASILKQTRRTYVQSSMANLDAKLRYMAMQPYAYTCGADAGADALGGIQSCRVNADYFQTVSHVAMAGVPCAAGAAPNSCGFSVTPPVLKAVDVGGQTNMVLSYQVHYEGTDFNFGDLGFDPQANVGIPIPTEILQSGLFDCSIIDASKPIFTGFASDGRPNCRAFKVCPVGQHVTEVKAGALDLTCRAPANTNVDCRAGDQQRIGQVTWADGRISAPCVPLPEARFEDDVIVTTTTTPTCTDQQILQNGVCVPRPPATCTDVTFTLNQSVQGPWSGSFDRSSQAVMMIDLAPYNAQIGGNCKASTFDASFGFWSQRSRLPACEFRANVRNAPFGSSVKAPESCSRCGGSGSKYQEAFLNVAADGTTLALVNRQDHWGDGGGNPTQPCISNPTITIHTVPR